MFWMSSVAVGRRHRRQHSRLSCFDQGILLSLSLNSWPNNRFSGIFSWINPYSRQFFLIKPCDRILSGIFSVIITSESALLGVYQEFLARYRHGCMEYSLVFRQSIVRGFSSALLAPNAKSVSETY